VVLILIAACVPPPGGALQEVERASEHTRAAEAAAQRVPDPARGGPVPAPGASPLPPFLGVSRATAHYVGSGTCVACHPDAGATWATSAHAHARDTLRHAQHGYDPACLPCHQTGLGHPGGATPHDADPLDHVGCEACHGPGSDHAAAPSAGYGALPRDASACVACHTLDNSPEFRFPAYWAKVAHGR
jgi:hypothetical protein